MSLLGRLESLMTGCYRPIVLKKSAIVFAAEKPASVIEISAFG